MNCESSKSTPMRLHSLEICQYHIASEPILYVAQKLFKVRIIGKGYITASTDVHRSVTMSVTISVRVDDEIKREIEELGHTPSEYIRKILIRELKKEHSQKALAWLKTHRLPSEEKSVEEEIREERDSR